MKTKVALTDIDWSEIQIIQIIHDNGILWDKLPVLCNFSRTLLNRALSLGLIKKIKHKFVMTESRKQSISISRKKYLLENPDKVPYLLNHHSKGKSYPEKYFQEIFESEKINLKYHKQVGIYQIDFFNEQMYIALEIDGEQHYKDIKIWNSDRRKDSFLKDLGWKVFRIRWSEYCRLSFDDKKNIILDIKNLLELNSDRDSLRLEIAKEKLHTYSIKSCKCGKDIDYRSKYCITCSRNNRPKKISIDPIILSHLISSGMSYTKIGKEYGVSDNTIKNYAKTLGLYKRKHKIKD